MSWDSLQDYYIGQTGIKPNEFWLNTWKENHLIGEAWQLQQNLEWERIRYMSAMIYNVNCQKKSQMIKPDKLFPLPQDVYLEKGKPKSTKEEQEAFEKLISKTKFTKKLEL